MAEQGKEEPCMEHTHRLLADMIYGDSPNFDAHGRMRPDSWELTNDIQVKSVNIYNDITEENFKELCDFFHTNHCIRMNGYGKAIFSTKK